MNANFIPAAFGIFSRQWLAFAAGAALHLTAAELGYRFGLRLFSGKHEARTGEIGGIEGSMLGLLGWLLGFNLRL